MNTTNIQERTFEFACRIIKLTESLGHTIVPRTIGRQVLRSGTSVGANLQEASGAQSKADFIAKCSIAVKEARETHYWLRLLTASRAVKPERLAPLVSEAEEIVAILTTIVKNAAKSQSRGHSTFNIQH